MLLRRLAEWIEQETISLSLCETVISYVADPYSNFNDEERELIANLIFIFVNKQDNPLPSTFINQLPQILHWSEIWSSIFFKSFFNLYSRGSLSKDKLGEIIQFLFNLNEVGSGKRDCGFEKKLILKLIEISPRTHGNFKILLNYIPSWQYLNYSSEEILSLSLFLFQIEVSHETYYEFADLIHLSDRTHFAKYQFLLRGFQIYVESEQFKLSDFAFYLISFGKAFQGVRLYVDQRENILVELSWY